MFRQVRETRIHCELNSWCSPYFSLSPVSNPLLLVYFVFCNSVFTLSNFMLLFYMLYVYMVFYTLNTLKKPVMTGTLLQVSFLSVSFFWFIFYTIASSTDRVRVPTASHFPLLLFFVHVSLPQPTWGWMCILFTFFSKTLYLTFLC